MQKFCKSVAALQGGAMALGALIGGSPTLGTPGTDNLSAAVA
jgi:hypothetical protein